MPEDKNLKQVIEFGDYLYKVGEKLHGEILGHDYLLEEGFNQFLDLDFKRKLTNVEGIKYTSRNIWIDMERGDKARFYLFCK